MSYSKKETKDGYKIIKETGEIDDSPHNTVYDWDYQNGEVMDSSDEGGFLGRPKGGEGRMHERKKM